MRIGYPALVYGVAILATLAAALVSLALLPILVYSRSVLFFAVIALNARLGGLGPGVLATLLSAIAFDVLFLPPTFGLSASFPVPLVPVTEFVAVGLLISVLSDRLRVAQLRSAREAAFLDTLLAAAPVGIEFLDRDLRLVRVNEALARQKGMTEPALRGRRLPEVSPGAWAVVAPAVERVLATGEPATNVEVVGTDPHVPTARRIWLATYYPVRVGAGPLLGIGGIVVDITARKEAEELRVRLAGEEATRAAAEAERARLAAILAHAPLGIVYVDAATGRVLANPQTDRLFGRPSNPAAGIDQYIPQIAHPDGRPLTRAELPSTHALHGEARRGEEVVIRRANGHTIPAIINAAPIRSANGPVEGVVVIFQDITLVKDIERTREELTAAVAHELRTPITVIRARAQLALMRGASEDVARHALKTIMQQADRVARTIEDLLLTIAIRPGVRAVHRERVPVETLAREVADRFARAHPDHVLSFRGDGRAVAMADRHLLGVVVDRLLANALRYSAEGQTIEIAVRRVPDRVEVAVTDHGVGIPPERQAHVFDPFYEVVPPGARGYVGTVSLDLYVARQIVEALGGRIGLTSAPGVGSTFVVSVPLAEEATSAGT